MDDDEYDDADWDSDTGDDDDQGVGNVVKPAEKKKALYEILTEDDIAAKQLACIKNVQDVALAPTYAIRKLLKCYHWDASRLLADWFDKGANSVYTKAHLPPPQEDDLQPFEEREGQCSVCFTETTLFCIPLCHHGLCETCWQGYLQMRVRERHKFIRCPGVTSESAKSKVCTNDVDEITVLKLGHIEEDPELLGIYKKSLVQAFVTEHPGAKWCPHPDCGHIVVCDPENLSDLKAWGLPVQCVCGNSFCLLCQRAPHLPASCDMMEQWTGLYGGSIDEEIAKVSTVKCPNCSAFVWRSSGCPNMHCAPPGGCGKSFCYDCGKLLLDGSHQCNRYIEDTSREKSAQLVFKFEFYRKRFESHREAERLEKTLSGTFEETRLKALCLLSGDDANANDAYYAIPSSEVKTTLQNAFQQLLAARVVLQNSYIFGYFREEKAPQIPKYIFEDRQHQLEIAVRNLATLLESENNEFDISLTSATNLYEKTDPKVVRAGYQATPDQFVPGQNVVATKPFVAQCKSAEEILSQWFKLKEAIVYLANWKSTIENLIDDDSF
eukprot:TRINITY_DN992_c0_g1::TRINITY_DN992_c0_g1_i1::g.15939::m.15939 TRINITY_DN992_c0_g1::TRINITY_DN992_c0_g1_i1::g.15939  ORF type:complete len:552 (+),score=48.13,sp/Q6NW85/ARI1L_DANRE/26.75/6e-38,IBR/PF01485.16/1.5e+04,IBR/PF01485.16/4.1e-10,IBR/PF01485.16/3.1e-05,zf-C3HC4_3/PF13920.1/0.015,zf-C3HC4_3/PF13920.1/9.8e+03,zf-C3HC4_3/PF13920.1/1.5e+04,zf-C3HC4_3/PF13920.1/1e+04,Viral_NABP/PF05515.6/0.17,Viral_NABP/PF05515.6/1.3e+04 TRINITY_DN992_c0_g1_i1:134-1789(+)